MATYAVTIPSDQQQELEVLAARESCSPENLLNRAIGGFIAREKYLQDGDEAYDHYRSTGLHLTHDEVDEWLEKLENGQTAELPECHT